MLKSKYSIGCLLALVLWSSCKKDESYDITGDPGVKFFFNNNPSPGNAPVNSTSYSVVNVPAATGTGLQNLSSGLPASIKIPVFASKPVSEDVRITAVMDKTLIQQYNTANNTSYAAFPDGLLSAGELVATIYKGATTSRDSMVVEVNSAALNLLSEKQYLAPIKLTAVSNAAGKITATESSMVTYLLVNTEIRRIKYLATAGEAQGVLLTGRNTWQISFTPAPGATTSGSVLDGSTTTYSRWTASPVQVDVNLQSDKNVTGLRLYTSTSTTYTPTQVEVSLSSDGINYDVIGAPLKANTTFTSPYSYILFYRPISAKYVRLKLYYSTSTNTQNFRLTELDVYAN